MPYSSRVCSAVLAVMLGACFPACGGSESAPQARLLEAAAEAPPPISAGVPWNRTEAPEWSRDDWGGEMFANRDGVLTKPDGAKVRGWGDRRVRQYVTALFERMQHDFMTGNYAAVCRHLDPERSSLIWLSNARAEGCAPRLGALARSLERRRFEPTRLRFLWVREYPAVAGIWVEDRYRSRYRIPFIHDPATGWLLQLDELQPIKALAMPLRVS